MFKYVSSAQFFADLPFHSTVADHGYLVAAQHFKTNRLGSRFCTPFS
jgi:hypothetical protein